MGAPQGERRVRRVSRRSILKGGAAAAIGAAAGLPRTARAQAAPRAITGRFRFTKVERTTIDAVADTFIVHRSGDDPGGASLGTFEYVARLLEGSLEDGLRNVFGGGPLRRDLSTFMAPDDIPVAKKMRWRRSIARDRGVYRSGIRALNEQAGADGFAALPLPARTALLRAAEARLLGDDLERFFATIFAHTMEAAYGHPVYGGNKGMKAWKRIGFPGDRFDDPSRTWGYTNEEIGEPG
jgi:gluconate 2-dehydrogenase gamma chain